MNKIKEIFVIFLLLIFCINSSNSTIKDSIIGTVGDKPVTSSDLTNEMKILLITNGENFSEVDKKKLQELAVQSITRRLIKKIEIEKYNSNNFNEEDVMNEIRNIANKLNINVDNLKNIFKSYKVNFLYLIDHIETELKWNGLIFNLYKNQISVNISEIHDQLKIIQNQDFIEEYLIYEIQIELLDQEKLQKKINEIKNEIQINGFEKTAIKYSKSTSALKGGRLGWFKETELSEKIKEILGNINVGSVAEPLRKPEGLIFLKLADKKKVEQKFNLEETKNILLKAEKNKKLKMYSLSHYNKLTQLTLINYNLQ